MPRKKLITSESLKNTSVVLTAESLDKLSAYAKLVGLTQSEMIRIAVDLYVDWLDFAREKGVPIPNKFPPKWFDKEDYKCNSH